MNIVITSTPYVDSGIMTITDGLLDLGHSVYCIGSEINYAQKYDATAVPKGVDLFLQMDSDNIGSVSYPSSMPDIRFHLHDRWVDYQNAPNSPVKPVPEIECDLLFVRDLDREVNNRPVATFPLDYGIERRYLEACQGFNQALTTERPYDVGFFGTLSTSRRDFYLSRLKTAVGEGVVYGGYQFNTADTKWSKWIYGRYTHNPDYYEALCQFKFIFVPMGAGPSTMRMGEAYAAGAVPLIQRYPSDIIPLHDFKDGENCVLWSDGSELIIKVRKYLNDLAGLEVLRKRCWEYGNKYLLTRHIAQYMLDRIQEVGPNGT